MSGRTRWCSTRPARPRPAKHVYAEIKSSRVAPHSNISVDESRRRRAEAWPRAPWQVRAPLHGWQAPHQRRSGQSAKIKLTGVTATTATGELGGETGNTRISGGSGTFTALLCKWGDDPEPAADEQQQRRELRDDPPRASEPGRCRYRPRGNGRRASPAWRAGDATAGNALIERYFDAIYRFFRSKLGEDIERPCAKHVPVVRRIANRGRRRRLPPVPLHDRTPPADRSPAAQVSRRGAPRLGRGLRASVSARRRVAPSIAISKRRC